MRHPHPKHPIASSKSLRLSWYYYFCSAVPRRRLSKLLCWFSICTTSMISQPRKSDWPMLLGFQNSTFKAAVSELQSSASDLSSHTVHLQQQEPLIYPTKKLRGKVPSRRPDLCTQAQILWNMPKVIHRISWCQKSVDLFKCTCISLDASRSHFMLVLLPAKAPHVNREDLILLKKITRTLPQPREQHHVG